MNNSRTLRNPINDESVVEKVIDRIINSIMFGELKKGSKLPTENELSKGLNIGRSSVREAIKVLVYLGVLEIKRPEGTFVTDGYSDKMFNPLLYSLILEDGDSSSIFELRRIFDVGTFRLAIERATIEDMDRIKDKCENLILILETESSNYEKVLQADIDFHTSIELAAHNPLVERVSLIITKLTIPSRLKATQKIISSGNTQFLIDSHKKIMEIITMKDVTQVLDVVDNSYFYWASTVSDN